MLLRSQFLLGCDDVRFLDCVMFLRNVAKHSSRNCTVLHPRRPRSSAEKNELLALFQETAVVDCWICSSICRSSSVRTEWLCTPLLLHIPSGIYSLCDPYILQPLYVFPNSFCGCFFIFFNFVK